jgi:cytosol alanyl aminopeptidase
VRWFVWALATATFGASPTPPGFRLPDDVVPAKYTVVLSIDPNKDTFEGTVFIEVNILKPTSTIWLNAKDLEPEFVQLSQGEVLRDARARVAGKELIAVDISGSPLTGTWGVYCTYRGRLDDKAVVGAYRRRVEGAWYVYTTFTPIEARRAIPCFDEPRFKTPWDLSIKTPQSQSAFANAAEAGETKASDGQKIVHFGVTQPLPSELVAFAVGPFDVYAGQSAGHGTAVRAITPKGEAAEGQPAADTTVTVLPRLEEYTGIPYAFGKLDHLALADAGFGAVENPGLIVYLAREMLMLPGSETIPRLHALHLLDAHEIGHQWFGDLVTQSTWADVWLSEGFATWISEKVMDQEDKPERAHLSLLVARERIMQADTSRRSRPVRVEPHDREGTRDIYNRFVYDKAADILLMLEQWLGEEKFRDGLRVYLRQHRFGNASTADLAAALKTATGVDPSAVMHAFLDSPGIPRVNVQIECATPLMPKTAPRVKIRQSGASAIPICIWAPGVERTCAVLDGPSRDLELPKQSACPAWVEPNAGGAGYYRTTWTAAQLAAVTLKDLSPAERLTLAYDVRSMPTDRPAARAMLATLAVDPVPEVARAAQDGLEPPSARGSTR